MNDSGSAPGKTGARGGGIQRLHSRMGEAGLDFDIREFPASTRTAAEAAEAIGCTIAQIAKSLVFRGRDSRRAILAVASGVNRVDLGRLGEIVGETLEKADAAFVREATDYAIGGVPPFGHPHPIATVIDSDLLRHDEIWAAAGTPRSVFRLTPAQLVDITGGTVADIAE